MATQVSTFNVSEETKVLKKRCCADKCKKRITLIDFDCRCGNRYCGSHRHPETHNCTFDHQAFAKTNLQKQLVKVDGQDSRLERI